VAPAAAPPRLAQAHDAAHFADPAHPDHRRPEWDDVVAVRAGLDAQASRGARRSARALPLSTLPKAWRGWLLQRRRARERKRDGS
jgi:hypothetical protein